MKSATNPRLHSAEHSKNLSVARRANGDQGLPEQQYPRMSASGSFTSFWLSTGYFRGRDASYLAPPAQIRTGPIRAYGSHLGCLTAKRLAGHGWRIRGRGSQSSANRLIRSQVVQSFWLRRRSVRRQRLVTWKRNAVRVGLFVGTA